MPLVFLDTETTGLCPDKNRIIQLYAEIPKLNQSINIEFNPEDGVIDKKALQINGLTEEMLRGPKRVGQKEGCLLLARWITKHLKGQRAQIVGHNAEFDCRFVQATFERERVEYKKTFHYAWECTLKLFLTLRNLRIICPVSLKLGDLAHYFSLPAPTHEACADVKTTIELYHVYYNVMKKIPKEVWMNGGT